MLHPAVIQRYAPETDRVRRIFSVFATRRPQPTADRWLVLWGPGDPVRAEAMRAHVAAGGRAIAFDLAYWSRLTHYRVTIDAPHPQAWIFARDWPGYRLERNKPPIANLWNPDGPVIVAGIGAKAHVQYGKDEVFAWERAQIAQCAGRTVRYRRKAPHGPALPETPEAPGGPIDEVLKGASLVITWHSNVAVDAIRLGIPVVCKDGVAAAVCPSDVAAALRPIDEGVRLRFLRNLAWFQWTHTEADDMWRWLRELLA